MASRLSDGCGSRLVDGMVGVQYTGRPRAGIYWQVGEWSRLADGRMGVNWQVGEWSRLVDG